jgi:hypothetical protein
MLAVSLPIKISIDGTICTRFVERILIFLEAIHCEVDDGIKRYLNKDEKYIKVDDSHQHIDG